MIYNTYPQAKISCIAHGANMRKNGLPTTEVQNTERVTKFCERAFSDKQLMATYKAGKQEATVEVLERYLEQGNYIPVLKELWSEEGIAALKRDWLRGQNSKLHAPLLAEQAVVELEAAEFQDIEKVLLETSFPLLNQALFRAKQDSKCSLDPSVYSDQEVANDLERIYLMRLKEMVREKGIRGRFTPYMPNFAVKAARLTLQDGFSYPSANWVAEEGNWVNNQWSREKCVQKNANMYSEHLHKQIRDEYAKSVLKI